MPILIRIMIKNFKSFVILILISSCSSSNNDIYLTGNLKANYSNDEVINFSVNDNHDSLAVYYSNKLVFKSNRQTKENISINLKDRRLGKNSVSIVIYTDNNYKKKNFEITLLNSKKPKLYDYRILKTYNHNIQSYTQGLEFHDENLYESVGRRGKSKLLITNFKTGRIIKEVKLKDKYFAEGLTILNDKIIQLSWTSKIGFIYDLNNLTLLNTFSYDKSEEGWGLCNDGDKIFKSDGSEKIWILNKDSLEEIDFIQVYTNKGRINGLNELEWVNGKIYANRYLKNGVAIINPKNGAVEGVIDFSNLIKNVTKHKDLDVLNGIAFNKIRNSLFVTGKLWDKIFEVELIEK